MSRLDDIRARRSALLAEIERTRASLATESSRLRGELGLMVVAATATRLLAGRFRWGGLAAGLAAVLAALRKRGAGRESN